MAAIAKAKPSVITTSRGSKVGRRVTDALVLETVMAPRRANQWSSAYALPLPQASSPLPALHDEADHLGRRLEMFARDSVVHLDRRIEGAGQGHVLDDRHPVLPGHFPDTQG